MAESFSITSLLRQLRLDNVSEQNFILKNLNRSQISALIICQLHVEFKPLPLVHACLFPKHPGFNG